MNRRQHTFHPELEKLEVRTVPSANTLVVAKLITHSAESQADQIMGDYQTYLQRTPSTVEVNGWLQQVDSGVSYQVLDAEFAASAEFVSKHGGGGAAWVEGLYADLLGRTGSPAEVNSWLTDISKGVSPGAVATAFANSTERLSDLVALDYQHYLGRAAVPGEVAGWVNAINNGMSEQDVVANLVASPEVVNGRDSGDLHQWVADVYQTVLGRPATEGEIVGWLNVLNNLAVSNCNDNSPNPPTGNTGSDSSGGDAYSPPSYIDTGSTDTGSTDAGYTDNSYTDNSGSDNSYTDNSNTDSDDGSYDNSYDDSGDGSCDC